MKIFTPITIFSRSSTSRSSPSPHLLTSHFLLFYSTSSEDIPRKRGELVAGRGTSHSFSSSSSSHNNDDPSRNVKVSVWWDFENCGMPNGVNAIKAAQNITSALRFNGIRGPVTITAFGDFIQLNRTTQENLSLTGISLFHVPNGGKNTADRSLLADLVFWVSQNPPPAHIFIISGDKDYANILHRLRMNNYNILLAGKDPVPGVLCSAASIMWVWSDLVRGESFYGKHFNEPPDGPQESWYGHFRGPLEDPIPDTGQPTDMQAGDSPDATTSFKPRAVPRSIVRQICQVVDSYPKGIDISELRVELCKSNVPIDKDFFGHKKFSVLLKSLSSVLRLQTADSQILVHSIQRKVSEPVRRPKVAEQVDQPKVVEEVDQPKIDVPVTSNLCPTDSETNNSDRSRIVIEELKGRKNITDNAMKESSLPPAHSLPKGDPPPVAPVDPTEGHSSRMEQNDSISEVGFFQRVWRTVLGHNDDPSNEKSSNSPEISSNSADSIGKRGPEERSISSTPSVSNLDEAILEEENKRTSEDKHKPKPRVGMFNKIVKWWRSGQASTNLDNVNGHFGEESNKMNNQIANNELFSRLGFWEDIRSFLYSPKGAVVISQSKTREQLAQQLQNEGPSHLNSLARDDLIHLVDLLISQKKWLEESNCRNSPFQLIQPAPTSSPSKSSRSSELSSLFSGKSSLSNFSGAPGLERGDGKKKYTQPGMCSDENNGKLSGKSKSEIISDFQKLVAELFREHPEGFNMGSFGLLFRERYGYGLNYQDLGHSRLASLFQIIPGVDTVSNRVIPSKESSKNVHHNIQNDRPVKISNSAPESSSSRGKVNDLDCLWNELGPILDRKSERNCFNLGSNEETIEGIKLSEFDNKPDLSDEFSDSEEESPTRYRSYRDTVIKDVEARSTLLDMLNAWDSKDDRGNKERVDSSDEVVECSRIDLKPSSEIESCSPLLQKSVWKKPRNTFSFIADTVGDENGKLVNELDDKEKMLDGILGSMKQTSGSRLQN